MNWHEKYRETRTFGEKLADNVAATMGSWRFIIIQSVFIILWASVNVLGIIYEWDRYPFILLNLLFSVQAAYAAPIIMMAQNRQNIKERIKAEQDYETNKSAKLEIEQLMKNLDRIELHKLDKIIEILEQGRPKLPSIDIEVAKDVAKKFVELNKFTGGFTPDEVSFIKGAEWEARLIVKTLESLDLTDFESFTKIQSVIDKIKR